MTYYPRREKLPVSGPLTNDELRASPVPVTPSLPVGAATEATLVAVGIEVAALLTDAELRAAPVPVSGPLTDAQLRASAVPVSLSAAIPAGTNNIGDVDVLSLPALPAGTNNIGDVDVLTLPALPAGTNNIGDVDVLTLPSIPAGANVIGALVANQSVNLAQVAGTAASVNSGAPDAGSQRVVVAHGPLGIGKAEDVAAATGDVGVPAYAVRKATPVNQSDLDGDYEPLQVSAGRLWASATIDNLPTLTKGTQGAQGISVQQLNNAGRNARAFMLDVYTAAPVAEALQSVVQWYGNAAVAGTTQPAVVPAGKILRLTSWSLSTKSLATVGSAVLRIRANIAGLVVIGSPLVWSAEVGSKSGATTVAMTGGLDQQTGTFPEGFEFPAGTGLGFTLAGYGPTGTLTLQGVTRFQVYGYEY